MLIVAEVTQGNTSWTEKRNFLEESHKEIIKELCTDNPYNALSNDFILMDAKAGVILATGKVHFNLLLEFDYIEYKYIDEDFEKGVREW